jgi:hypothetical protein
VYESNGTRRMMAPKTMVINIMINSPLWGFNYGKLKNKLKDFLYQIIGLLNVALNGDSF